MQLVGEDFVKMIPLRYSKCIPSAEWTSPAQGRSSEWSVTSPVLGAHLVPEVLPAVLSVEIPSGRR